MNLSIYFLLAVLVLLAPFALNKRLDAQVKRHQEAKNDMGIHQFILKTVDGRPMPLTQFKGKVVLLVNVASKCGFTKQYDDLQKLYETYKDKGLVIIGIPANNFGGQEPGSNSEIAKFCKINFGVTFPISEKISVKGNDIHPLYHYLTSETSNRKAHGDISWNFNKFLIDQNGKVVARYGSMTNPLSPKISKEIDTLLN